MNSIRHLDAGMVHKPLASQLLPVPALCKDSVSWIVLLSVDITATVGPLDAHAILKSESVSYISAITRCRIALRRTHTPEAESPVDTGTLVCSSCVAPW